MFTSMMTVVALAIALSQQPAEGPRLYGSLRIEYPDLLRQARVEGRVLARVLVDSTGRVVPESTRVLSSTNPGFDLPVKRALQTLWFPGPPGRAATLPVAMEVWFLARSAALFGGSYARRGVERDPLRAQAKDRALDLSTCGRLMERATALVELQPLPDSLLRILQCRDAPVIAPLVIAAIGRTSWDGDTAKRATVATMGYRFRTVDALLTAAQVAEDSALPASGRVYGFQVLSVLVHPDWAWRLSPDTEGGCDRVMVFNAPPDTWGDSWPVTADAFARRVAERTLRQRELPAPVRVAASCLLDLLKDQ
jgi:Gram-negative bacterial TonB protein C-terminal